MRIDINIGRGELNAFEDACEVAIRNVGRGSKAATIEAGVSIMTESLNQVPVDTGTLAGSSFLGVSRRGDVKGYVYGAVMGYGSPDQVADATALGSMQWLMRPSANINPKNGMLAREYATDVHEDLETRHKNGNAKFLENPVRDWSNGKFARVATTYWRREIENSNKQD